MPIPPDGKLPHLIVNGFFETSEYTRPGNGGSKEFPIPRRERDVHARRLLDQLQVAQAREQEITDSQRAYGIDVGNGIYIEFESEPEFELKFDSLGYQPSGIELCLVKQVESKYFATVFVPEGKLDHFLRRITQYREEDTVPKDDTDDPKPRHMNLVDSISNIRLASLEALWTDEPSQFPQTDDPFWWEVWLRQSDKIDYEGVVRAHLARMEVPVVSESIKFIDRTIILVKGSKKSKYHLPSYY